MRFSGKQYYTFKPRISELLSRKHGLYLDLGNSKRKNFESDLCITRHRTLVGLLVGDLNVFWKLWVLESHPPEISSTELNFCQRALPLSEHFSKSHWGEARSSFVHLTMTALRLGSFGSCDNTPQKYKLRFTYLHMYA